VIGRPPSSGAVQDNETDVAVLELTRTSDGAPGTEAAATDIEETPMNESDTEVDDRRVEIFDRDGRLDQIALGTSVTPTGASGSLVNGLPSSDGNAFRAGSIVGPSVFCSAVIWPKGLSTVAQSLAGPTTATSRCEYEPPATASEITSTAPSRNKEATIALTRRCLVAKSAKPATSLVLRLLQL
jgi:hypothetical protein